MSAEAEDSPQKTKKDTKFTIYIHVIFVSFFVFSIVLGGEPTPKNQIISGFYSL
jgi:hypothetical protein